MQVYASQEKNIAGKHLIIDAVGSEQHLLNDEKLIRESLIDAANAGKFLILNISTHKFAPRGVTAYALLAESHIAIHTRPEHNYAAIDIFSYNPEDNAPMFLLNELKARLKLEKIKITSLKRGKL